MSTDVILAWWGKYWGLAAKILALTLFTGIAYAKVPTEEDIRKQIQSADNPYVAQREHIPTRDAVKRMLKGPDNPYIPHEALILRVVGRYDSDREALVQSLADIQLKLGLLLDRADRKRRKR